MIQQGTDGLSRGIWVMAFHSHLDSGFLTAYLFAPLSYCPRLVDEIMTRCCIVSAWQYLRWDCVWDARRCFGTLTVWFPPPEIARQVLSFVLSAWVEQPLVTLALFFIPRVVPAFWLGLSRHLIELVTLFPYLDSSLSYVSQPFPLLVVVLYLAPHIRSLPSPSWLERLPVDSETRWYKAAAAHMCGLPPRPLP